MDDKHNYSFRCEESLWTNLIIYKTKYNLSYNKLGKEINISNKTLMQIKDNIISERTYIKLRNYFNISIRLLRQLPKN